MKKLNSMNLARRAFVTYLLFSFTVLTHAAQTDLANAPLFTASSTTAILPNIMFMLDDSGSMANDYVPDYVNDRECFGSKDGRSDITDSTLDYCFAGDPPYMSPDFNKQYYNPEIRYSPPIRSDQTSYGNQSPTAAATDVYGIQRRDMLNRSATTVDLTTQWPDRLWCTDSSGTSCVSNAAATGYKYPDTNYGNTATAASDCISYNTLNSGTSSKCVKYQFGAPYYWRITPSEYCSDETLSSCIAATAPSGSYTVPATVRWCSDRSLTNCQAKALSSYPYPRMLGNVTPGVSGGGGTYATASITVTRNNASGDIPLNYTVSSISFKGTTITSSSVTMSSGSNSNRSTRRDTLAQAIRNSITAANGAFVVQDYTNCTNAAGLICLVARNIGTASNATAASDVAISQPTGLYVSWTGSGPGGGPSGGTNALSGTTTRNRVYTFDRVDIVPSRTTYPKYTARTDCGTGSTCSYAQELQNFANWFTYYRTRMQSMKSGAGVAFQRLDDKYRVGFATINQNSYSSTSGLQLLVDQFIGAQKTSWYNDLYAANPGSSTPLRTALKRVGNYYAGTLGVTDPIQYSCQSNFTILTTDGYWNESTAPGVGNQDNDPSDGYSTRASGSYDGGVTGASDTLADVAMYYYKTDLRTAMANNVRATSTDPATHQHMTTFTLGLGVDGIMRYDPNYGTSTADLNGDFAKIVRGDSGCAWASGICNWPLPASNTLTAVDDLWHAAVNGHGRYYSAGNPQALQDGIADALSRISGVTGMGAAAATSTPNITQSDRIVVSGLFTVDPGHDDWAGEVKLGVINLGTQAIDPAYTWLARDKLDTVDPVSRRVFTYNGNGVAPKNFTWTSLVAEAGYFNNKGSLLSQYSSMSATDQATVDNGQTIVDFIRGVQTLSGTLLRDRQHLLGPVINAKPAYVKTPIRNYADTGYATFRTQQANRSGRVYIAANDGMLHAFDGNVVFDSNSTPQPTGNELAERWAYVPKIVMPTLPLLAEKRYATNQRYTVDGSPVSGDAYFGGSWHTVLVGGLNKGGRGYYALDVTDPDNPTVLWELCSDSTLCTLSDADMGYSFGNPIITKRADGKWVVYLTSGLNNVSPGSGVGYLYQVDLATGSILSKVSTQVGSSTTPSGLMKISAWIESPTTNNTATFIYGGDQLGNLWRFNVTGSGAIPTPVRMAGLQNSSNQTQPVTVEPALGYCAGQRMVFLGTGRLLGTSDLTDNTVQTMYGIKDSTVDLGNNVRTNNMVQQVMAATGNQTRTFTFSQFNPSTQNGWFIDLTAQVGEKITVAPKWALGVISFAGNYPNSTDVCTQGRGTSVVYDIDACSATVTGTTAYAAQTVGITSFAYGTKVSNLECLNDGTCASRAKPVPAQGVTGLRVSWREVLE